MTRLLGSARPRRPGGRPGAVITAPARRPPAGRVLVDIAAARDCRDRPPAGAVAGRAGRRSVFSPVRRRRARRRRTDPRARWRGSRRRSRLVRRQAPRRHGRRGLVVGEGIRQQLAPAVVRLRRADAPDPPPRRHALLLSRACAASPSSPGGSSGRLRAVPGAAAGAAAALSTGLALPRLRADAGPPSASPTTRAARRLVRRGARHGGWSARQVSCRSAPRLLYLAPTPSASPRLALALAARCRRLTWAPADPA